MVMVLKNSFLNIVLIVILLAGCDTDTASSDESPDPVLVEYPVVYIERENIIVDEGDDDELQFPVKDPVKFNPGAKLYLKANALFDTKPRLLTDLLLDTVFSAEQKIDLRDLTVAPNGEEFLISIRAPELEDVDDEEQPKWNIWRYILADDSFTPVISDQLEAEKGDDLMASYLPDGRIVFASNRQKISRAILLDEGKPQYSAINERMDSSAFNIHIMQADGSSISQLSFNLSHDFYPLVLQNGKILYSRWDAMGGNDRINLYQVNPDGTENEYVYGWHSQQFLSLDGVTNIDYIKPQQLPSGEILLLVNSTDSTRIQKQPILINITEYVDENQPFAGTNNTASAVQAFLPEQGFNFSEQLNGPGRISQLFAFPDSSNRFLFTFDLCRAIVDDLTRACGQLTEEQLNDPDLLQAPSFYELWLFNQSQNTQQRIASPAQEHNISEAIIMQPSDVRAIYIPDKIIGNELDTQLYNQQSGALHIRSVYDFDGSDLSGVGIDNLKDPLQTPAEQLPARFIRIVRGVPMPPDEIREVDGTDFGRSRGQLMREIIGYSPIQPDGSVKVKVPANVPFAISILDQNGQRIGGRHRQWISVRPGETLQCLGCHTTASELPHGRIDAQMPSINAGATADGVAFKNTSSSILPQFGQTMAEAAEVVYGIAELSPDLEYVDLWSDPNISTVNPDKSLAYEGLETLAPNGTQCFNNWNAYCRLQINYIEHIQPIWELSRQIIDRNSNELIADQTCTLCHSPLDAENVAQVPAGQLDLSGSASSDEPAHLTSYRELFFNDIEQTIIDGILVNKLVEVLDEEGNVVYEVDQDGELILDENGAHIPVLTTVPVPSMLTVAGASQNAAFFNLFSQANHLNMLSEDELRLLSEWLDIGAQYYNTPFYERD